MREITRHCKNIGADAAGTACRYFAERKFSIDTAGVFPVIWCSKTADKAVKLQ